MPTSQSLPCFVLKLFFFFSKLLLVFSFFFCSLCFNCAQEMVDHHHHLFLWKNLYWAHRARHYSLASLVPWWNKMISEEVFIFQLISPIRFFNFWAVEFEALKFKSYYIFQLFWSLLVLKKVPTDFFLNLPNHESIRAISANFDFSQKSSY